MGNEIQIFMDYILIFDQRIDRPDRISRNAWMALWEKLAKS
jgi:hypothetical protein